MVERNPCREINCPASCCHDISIWVRTTKERLTQLFENPTEIKKSQFDEQTEKGVYFYQEQDRLRVRLVGPCPNLGDDFYCEIYPKRPTDCRGLLKESSECSRSRIRDFLPPIPLMKREDISKLPQPVLK